MIALVTILGEYLGVSIYHPGLVYSPTERVMNMVTMWAESFSNTGSSKRYLKIIQAFCRYYERGFVDKNKAAKILPNFERFINRNNIKKWMSDRWKDRMLKGGESPLDRTIEDDAFVVNRYLIWAKEELSKQGVRIPYDGGGKKIKVVHLKRDKNMLAGAVDAIKVEQLKHDFHLSHKPVAGMRPQTISKSTQGCGHEYLKPDELKIFIVSFVDPVWTFAAMTAYHTGLRPHELFAVPRYRPYSNDKFFTSDPLMLKKLKDDGEKELIYECYGKGGKVRNVIFVIDEWLAIMILYEPFFQERRRYFERNEGRKLETHELWLTRPKKTTAKMVQYCKPGDQLNYDAYLQPLRSAVSYAKKKHGLVEKFGHNVDFYSLRHTFATNFIVAELKRNTELRERVGQNPDILLKDYFMRKRLQDQLGHESFETTFKHYIDNAFALSNISFPSLSSLIATADEDGSDFLSL